MAVMFTRSSDSSWHTPARAPGLLGSLTLTSVRIDMRERVSERLEGRARREGKTKKGRNGFPAIPAPSACPASRLREHFDDDAAVLSAARLRLVRRCRLVFAVADDVHLVQRNLILLIEVPLDRLGALESDLLVDELVADVVRVSFDLDEHVFRILLLLLDHLVDLLLGFLGKSGLTELEVALIFDEDVFVLQ